MRSIFPGQVVLVALLGLLGACFPAVDEAKGDVGGVDSTVVQPDSADNADTTAPTADANDAVDTVDGCPATCADLYGPCTRGECVEGQCVATALTGPACDDGLACTDGDQCADGVCVGVEKVCDDNLACTADVCTEPGGECAFDPAGCPCDGVEDCDDGDPCNGVERCGAAKTCVAGTAIQCPANPSSCRVFACNSSVGACVEADAEEGAGCDDGDACTTVDACHLGMCRGEGPVSCASVALGPCEESATCNGSSGQCEVQPKPDQTPCFLIGGADGLCRAGACEALPQVSAGFDHTCGVLAGGRVRCWGKNDLGQLGYGNTVDVGDGVGPSVAEAGDVPVGAAVKQVSAGWGFTCAVTVTDTVRCWGGGAAGRLGYNNTVNVGDGIGPSPAAAGDVPVGKPVKRVDCGAFHVCVLTADNRLRCWGPGPFTGHGLNANVGDGIGPTIASLGDVPVGGHVSRVGVGGHSCALMETGRVRCWGLGSAGQLGYDAPSDVGTPDGLTILDAGDVLFTNVTDVAAGSGHTCALQGTILRCWGNGAKGALGYGNTLSAGDGSGVAMSSLGSVSVGGGVRAVSAMAAVTCALMADSKVKCWGSSGLGLLGLPGTTAVGDGLGPSVAAAPALELGGPIKALSEALNVHQCAVRADGAVLCWGFGGDGRLGNGATDDVGLVSDTWPPTPLNFGE